MMWLGGSLRSWMMYSPRSVSTGISPFVSRQALSPISSETMDLPLVTVFARASRRISRMIARASAASRAQWTCPAPRDDVALESLKKRIEIRDGMIADRFACVAQAFEIAVSLGSFGAAQTEMCFQPAERTFERGIVQRLRAPVP